VNFAIRFVVPGDPVPKARARIGRFGRTYTPEKTVAYEELVAWSAKKAMLDACAEPLNSESRFAVTMDFYLGTERRIDLDNLQKAILDGLTPRKPKGRGRPPGLFWRDDSQVDIIAAQKGLASAFKCEPCAVIVVRLL
jgi:Holliday junction resolvase RusA-like endonuclease